MHITDIKAFPVWIGTRNQMLVKVETNEGIYGWGESGLSTRELGVKGIIDHYKEWLIGRDPLKRGALWQEMYRSQYFEGGRTLTAAISSIDIFPSLAFSANLIISFSITEKSNSSAFLITGAISPFRLLTAIDIS